MILYFTFDPTLHQVFDVVTKDDEFNCLTQDNDVDDPMYSIMDDADYIIFYFSNTHFHISDIAFVFNYVAIPNSNVVVIHENIPSNLIEEMEDIIEIFEGEGVNVYDNIPDFTNSLKEEIKMEW